MIEGARGAHLAGGVVSLARGNENQKPSDEEKEEKERVRKRHPRQTDLSRGAQAGNNCLKCGQLGLADEGRLGGDDSQTAWRAHHGHLCNRHPRQGASNGILHEGEEGMGDMSGQ